MKGKSGFSPSILIFLVLVAVGLYGLSSLFDSFSRDPKNDIHPTSWSRSAIGHAGFYRLLEKLGYDVRRNRASFETLEDKDNSILLLVIPDRAAFGRDLGAELSDRLQKSNTVFVVLPKWDGISSTERRGWVDDIFRRDSKSSTLQIILSELPYKRKMPTLISTAWPQEWSVDKIGFALTPPKADTPLQLLKAEGAVPLVATKDGILLAEFSFGYNTIWVLSDPDILSNWGLDKGENALFALALIDRLSKYASYRGKPTLIFDETLHGYGSKNDSLESLFLTPPFIGVTLLFFLLLFLLLWSGYGRFGRPKMPLPEIGFGKKILIDNSARLLDASGHQDAVLRRYVQNNLIQAGQTLHAPNDLDTKDLALWLDHIGKVRGTSLSAHDIFIETEQFYHAKDLSALMRCAVAIHRWKGELLYGSGTDRLHSPPHQN